MPGPRQFSGRATETRTARGDTAQVAASTGEGRWAGVGIDEPGAFLLVLPGEQGHARAVAPGVEDASLLEAVFAGELAAFGAQSPQLATRYR